MINICNRGLEFRTSYGKLGGLRALTNAPFMALTASAPPDIQSKIIESLNLQCPFIVSLSLDRPNIYLSASPIRNMKVSHVQ